MIHILKSIPEVQKKEAIIFLMINAAFPLFIGFIIDSFNTIPAKWALAIPSILLILIANIYRIVKAKLLRKLYIAFTILNILTFFLLSDIAFLTSIHKWPIVLRSLYELTLGDGYVGQRYFLGF